MKLEYINIVPKIESWEFGDDYNIIRYRTKFGKWLQKQYLIIVGLVYIGLFFLVILEAIPNLFVIIFNLIFSRLEEH